MLPYPKIQTVYLRDPETKFKTVLENAWSLESFDYLKNNDWLFTEKVDGMNIRVMWDGKNISFGGKSINAQIPTKLLLRLQQTFLRLDVQLKFKEKFGEEGNVCLYGEGYGNKIQKAGVLYRPDQDFVLFDVKVGDFWLKRKDIIDVATDFSLATVPILTNGTLYDMVKLAKTGFVSRWGDFPAEGIVARPIIELKERNGQRVIAKIKLNDFKK